jgi:hypothetical protein
MATNTYVELRRETVAVATSTVTFDLTGISGYTDLEIVCNYASSNALSFLVMQLNGDTGANYALTSASGSGSTLTSSQGASLSPNWIGYQVGCGTALGGTISTIKLLSYANSHSAKNYFAINGNSGVSGYTGVEHIVGLWNNTAPITSITLRNNTGGTFYNFAVGSTFSLYGIKAEPQISTAKATGGTVYFAADGYTYHKFTSSGTFTPSQALTADLLVVGAGGGGAELGGGGGAGGLLLQSGRSLSSGVGYTVTVNGGGAGGVGYGVTPGVGGTSVFDTVTANGGGYGGSAGAAGGGGGSGGGGGTNTGGAANQGNSGGATGYGNAGGSWFTGSAGRGGGGGAGGVGGGGFSKNFGHDGGVGLTNSLINAMGGATLAGQQVGADFYFAGGGGGSGDSSGASTSSSGGYGGGGAGRGNSPSTGGAGTANTGGGGGGGGHSSGTTYSGGNGGSGIVIVRYLG